MERTRARLHRGATGTFLLAVLLAVGLVQTPAHANTTLEHRMLRLTNEARARRDLPRLHLDNARADRARKHSVAMARDGYLSHTADPTEVYLRDVRWSRWGENVGDTGGGADLRPLQRAFMASPEHRENVLEPSFDRVAIGVVMRDGEAWVTLFFYG
jgi:uncharacterized protein YkwD